MKFRRLLFLILAGTLAQLAQARPVRETVDPTAFGALQAVIDFCSKIAPGNDKNFDLQARFFLNGLGQDAVDQARQSSLYKNSYSSLAVALTELTPGDAVSGCAAIPAPPQQAPRERPFGR